MHRKKACIRMVRENSCTIVVQVFCAKTHKKKCASFFSCAILVCSCYFILFYFILFHFIANGQTLLTQHYMHCPSPSLIHTLTFFAKRSTALSNESWCISSQLDCKTSFSSCSSTIFRFIPKLLIAQIVGTESFTCQLSTGIDIWFGICPSLHGTSLQ